MVQYLSPSRNTPSARFARALLSTASARVAVLALLQLLVGLTLLGIYEGYKTAYFNGSILEAGSEDLSPAERQQLAAGAVPAAVNEWARAGVHCSSWASLGWLAAGAAHLRACAAHLFPCCRALVLLPRAPRLPLLVLG